MFRSAAPTLILTLCLGCEEENPAGLGDDVADLRERMSAVEAVLNDLVGGGGGDGGDPGGGADDGSGAADGSGGGDGSDGGTDTGAADGADGDDLASRVAALEAALTEANAAVEAERARLDAAEARLDVLESTAGGVGVWQDDGSGTGTCALVSVITTSSAPLLVFAEVEYSSSISGAFGYYYDPSLYSNVLKTASGGAPLTMRVLAENVGGAVFASESSVYTNYSLTLSGRNSPGDYDFYEGGASSSAGWSVVGFDVLEIPAAGHYEVEVEVSGTGAGDCRLRVVQPR